MYSKYIKELPSWNAQISPGHWQVAWQPQNIRFEIAHSFAVRTYVALLCSGENMVTEFLKFNLT